VCVCVLVKLWAVDDVIALQNIGATRYIPGMHSMCLVVAEKGTYTLPLLCVVFTRKLSNGGNPINVCLSVNPG
jgi:hypothetical protein